MTPDGWSEDADVARWEAVEAEARAREGRGAKVADRITEGPRAQVDEAAPARWDEELVAPDPTGPVEAGTSPVAGDKAPADPGAGADILLADGDPAIGASLEQAMSDRGWIVRRVDSGELAFAEFLRLPPDCFVLDYSLPGLSGLGLLRRLAEVDLAGGTRIVVNSTQTQTVHVQRARAMGADRFLDRPIRSPDEVVEAVAGQLAELARQDTATAPPDAGPAAEPSMPEQASSPPEAPVGGLFGDISQAPGEPGPPPADPVGPDRHDVNEDRSLRSSFGSGGGPPGRVPKLD